jgi:hypothetical protein
MKLFISVIVLIFVSLFVNKTVDAHVLKTDNAIGAILHVNPDDDPIAGEPTQFFFALKDKQNKFATDNCDCQIRITQNGKTLIQQNAQTDPDNKQALLFTYTFPQTNVYQVTLLGKSTSTNTFQPFSLTYDIRVAREKEGTNTNQNAPLLIVISAVIIGLTLAFIWKR